MVEKYKQNVRSIVFRLLAWLVNWFDLSRKMALQLCQQEEIALLPPGCRPIPVHFYELDPAIAEIVGVNQALVYQKIRNWIVTNARKGESWRAGRTWTYGSYNLKRWGEEIPLWHHKTVAKYCAIVRLPACSIGDQINPARPKQYALSADSARYPAVAPTPGITDSRVGNGGLPQQHKETLNKTQFNG